MPSNSSPHDLVGASPAVHCRVAALFGLVMLASGTYANHVATALVVPDDPAVTARNLVAAATTYRLGILSALVMMLAFLLYGLLLFRLLRPVDGNLALVMLGLVATSVPLYMLNQAQQVAALAFAQASRPADLAQALTVHRFGNLVGAIFFGLWLLPLGLLVWRSGFLPRSLGALLVLGSPGYVILFVQGFLRPGTERTLWSNPLLIVTHVAELALLLWLGGRGVTAAAWRRRAGSTAEDSP